MRSPFDGRPRIFRDPIHGDIEWPKSSFGELVSKLIDTPAFQRLRHIRQNGVTNLVFHGAEHSRFAHSIGVAWTAAKMLDAVERNSGEPIATQVREDTILAALLHDVGHGPFSHTLEEILGHEHFDHEAMTVRFLTEPGSEIAQLETKARDLAGAAFPSFDLDSLVAVDTPSRVNYKRYAVDGDFPIFTWERDATKPRRIEDIEEVRSIVPKVARKFYRSRIFVPPEILDDLRAFAAKERLL